MDDALPIAEVGEWTLEKHERLRRYVDITWATRRLYTDTSKGPKYKGGAVYIDLFCGPGAGRVRGTNQIIDGSPLVAYKAATRAPFSEIHIADTDPSACNAAAIRLAKLGARPHQHVGPAQATAQAIVARLNPYGLHFAFLDPYNLDSLTWDSITTFRTLRRVDLLLHVSVLDLQRNIDRYAALASSPLDSFAPGWREKVNLSQSMPRIRQEFVAYWQSKLQDIGFGFRGVDLVTGSRNQRLYWLIFLSRSDFAKDLWDKIRNISGQTSFKL